MYVCVFAMCLLRLVSSGDRLGQSRLSGVLHTQLMHVKVFSISYSYYLILLQMRQP